MRRRDILLEFLQCIVPLQPISRLVLALRIAQPPEELLETLLAGLGAGFLTREIPLVGAKMIRRLSATVGVVLDVVCKVEEGGFFLGVEIGV